MGVQKPRLSSIPKFKTSRGDEAIELAAMVGLHLDPWQQLVLQKSLGENNGKWSAFEVGLIVPRQNGKGAILEARELAGLFLFDERLILHSAHEFKTAAEAFIRIRALVENSDMLRRRVKIIRTGVGTEGIELKNGNRLKFVARTSGSGRGFSGDCIILDEAFNLTEMSIGALMPTLSARPNPQLWYTSSAVDQTVHPNGIVLSRIRKRGLSGKDEALAYMEWSVDEDEFDQNPIGTAFDPKAWAVANPGLGIRLSVDHTLREHRSMATRTFATERLGIGDWPADTDEGWLVIPKDTWDDAEDVDSQPVEPFAFAADINPERTYGAIGLAALRADGLEHVELIEHRSGTAWLLDRIIELNKRWKPCAVVIDPAGEIGMLVEPLTRAKVKVVTTNAREAAQAHGAFVESVLDKKSLRHLGQPQLSQALAGATQRKLSDAHAWDRRGGTDISPLVAVTLALWGRHTHAKKQPNIW
jgi:phage terminase large subunit-like protein